MANNFKGDFPQIHQWKAYLFSSIYKLIIYKSQFWKMYPYAWFCGPGSHIIIIIIYNNNNNNNTIILQYNCTISVAYQYLYNLHFQSLNYSTLILVENLKEPLTLLFIDRFLSVTLYKFWNIVGAYYIPKCVLYAIVEICWWLFNYCYYFIVIYCKCIFLL